MNKYAIFICISVLMGLFLCNINVKADESWTADKDTVALWKFDDGSGIIATDAVGKNSGKITGCNWIDGKYGKALHFNGDGYYVDCGNGASSELSSAITVEVRFRLSELDFEGFSWSNIINQFQMGSKGYAIEFYLGQLSCGIATDSGWYNIEIGQSGYANQTFDKDWHVARMVYDGSLLSLWYDNNLVGSTKASGTIQPGKVNLWIGGFESVPTGRGFRDDIDEVRISNAARQNTQKSLSNTYGKNTVTVKNSSNSKCVLEETEENIILRNGQVEYTFDKTHGSSLSKIKDMRSPAVKFDSEEKLLGEWNLEFENKSPIFSSATKYVSGEFSKSTGQAVLKLITENSEVRLTQLYTLKDKADYLICRAVYENLTDSPVVLQRYKFLVNKLAIGGDVSSNEFIYPPGAFHFFKGKIKDASADYMNKKYIYGSMQPTDKLMLPYAMVYDDNIKECVVLVGVNSRCRVSVGIIGGSSSSITSSFDIFKTISPKQSEDIKTVYLALLQGDWQKGTQSANKFITSEAGYKTPETLPKSVKNLVVFGQGVPAAGCNTFDDVADTLEFYKSAGVNAIFFGGRHFFCPYSKDTKTVEGMIPIPQNGYVVPDPQSGGIAGFERLISKSKSLGIKLCVWGPVSMAGIAISSEETKTKPDWWIYNRDGSLNKWYSFMAPPNAISPGWREFFLNNVKKIVQDYKVHGFWLDSSSQDHGLNYSAKDGWYGGPNGAKFSLVSDIVNTSKGIDPECVVMAEGCGAELYSRVDIAYLQCFGIWPAIGPDEVQQLVIAEELNRIPGVRPFGLITQGLGFYPELGAETKALTQKYVDSWIAKTFLVSTLDRIPFYLAMDWSMEVIRKGKITVSSANIDNPDLRLAEKQDNEKIKRWFSVFKQVNKVRKDNAELIDGKTIFDCINVSSDTIVHYLRSMPKKQSIVLLNADTQKNSFDLKISKPNLLGISPSRSYQIKNLMNNKLITNGQKKSIWKGSQIINGKISITLDGYEGAVLKIEPMRK